MRIGAVLDISIVSRKCTTPIIGQLWLIPSKKKKRENPQLRKYRPRIALVYFRLCQIIYWMRWDSVRVIDRVQTFCGQVSSHFLQFNANVIYEQPPIHLKKTEW